MTDAVLDTCAQTILVVDDDHLILDVVHMMLTSNGIKDVVTLNTSSDVLKTLDQGGVGVLVMDWIMPGMTGADLLPIIVQRYSHIPVIIMTVVSDLRTVVDCIKQGAFDYITKPIDANRLLFSINKAFQISELANQNRRLKDYLMGDSLSRPEVFDGILTANPRMQAIFKIVETMGNSHNPVLITGETGVGKELIARAIHRASGLKGPFVPLNVAGLILMFDRTIQMGDMVEVDGHRGRVATIGMRSSTIKRFDGVEMLVPNSHFLQQNVTNWTASDKRARYTISVGVAYGSPTQKTERLILAAVEEQEEVLRDPSACVIFEEFADSSLKFTAYFWIELDPAVNSLLIFSDIRHRIGERLAEAGIVIPFPQRDLHLDAGKPLEITVVRNGEPGMGNRDR